MPPLHPFQAVRYAASDGELSTRIAPPYDVLDEAPKRALLSRDPLNIVAIDLPVTPPKTVGPDAAYAQAHDTYEDWMARGVLRRDTEPALYGYEQVFNHDGRTFARRGLFAVIELESVGRHGGGIHAHEGTIAGGLSDRYKLMAATRAQLSPVFCVFPDPAGTVEACLSSTFERRDPDFSGHTENDDVVHRVWRISDAAIIEQLQTFFAPTDVFIADGHHRYITARNYAQDHADEPAAQHVLVMLVAVESPGMIVLPTHRVFGGLSNAPLDQLMQSAADDTRVDIALTNHGPSGLGDLASALDDAGPHAMGLYDGGSQQTAIVTSNGDPLASTHAAKPDVWRQLDVAILEHLIIDDLIRPRAAGEDLTRQYTASLDDLRTMCEAEPGRLGVLMQPTPLASVCAVSLAGEVMPAKSTFFYPKLATGLVIHPLTE